MITKTLKNTKPTVKKPVTQRKALDQAVKAYIIEAIDGTNYIDACGDDVVLNTEKEKLEFLHKTYVLEMNRLCDDPRQFNSWLQGLPSCFNIDFENYKILELARAWGSISPELKGKALERREDLIINNWFNFITVKTFQLFRKYGVK